MTRSSGITESVLGFMTSNSGRPVTATEMEEALSLTRAQILSGIHHARTKTGGITTISKGVYRFDALEAERHRASTADDVFLIQVIQDDGDKRLVRIDGQGELWSMRRLDY